MFGLPLLTVITVNCDNCEDIEAVIEDLVLEKVEWFLGRHKKTWGSNVVLRLHSNGCTSGKIICTGQSSDSWRSLFIMHDNNISDCYLKTDCRETSVLQ